jgi:phosphoglycerate dehydrogenase-like enzyme
VAKIIGVLPADDRGLAEAVRRGGGKVGAPGAGLDGLVVAFGTTPDQVRAAVADHPGLSWVQLPLAGVDTYLDLMRERSGTVWTSTKGAYAGPVGEHALALTLALLRHLPERARAASWGKPAGTPLADLETLVIGAGGVALETVRLLKAFGARVTVVRRRAEPAEHADRTSTGEHLRERLAEAEVVVVAAALTTGTRHLIGERELAAMRPSAVLVNVARGPLVDTAALVAALRAGTIRAAALDVTDPEPLPDGHPLWSEPAALITPHTADTYEMITPLFHERIADNVARFAAGKELTAVVDLEAGY